MRIGKIKMVIHQRDARRQVDNSVLCVNSKFNLFAC